jgi:Putative peptidoglycan binding domain
MKMLRLGSKGPAVGHVQRALNARMLPPNNTITRPPMERLAEDNDFGSRTKAMVMEFQRINDLQVDGIVGPDTFYLLYPYIAFSSVLYGQGPLRGTPNDQPHSLPPHKGVMLARQMSRHFPQLAAARGPLLATTGGRPAVGDGDDKEDEPEGLGVEASVSPGFKREFRPWFVLKPDEPEGAQSFSTITVEGVIVRKKGFEAGAELEFSRRFAAGEGTRWKWEGTLFGKYMFQRDLGPVSAAIGPLAELKVRQGLQAGAAVGAEAELSVALSKDLLELSVGGKAGAQWDIHEGQVQGGFELSAGLKLKWEIVRFPRAKK